MCVSWRERGRQWELKVAVASWSKWTSSAAHLAPTERLKRFGHIVGHYTTSNSPTAWPREKGPHRPDIGRLIWLESKIQKFYWKFFLSEIQTQIFYGLHDNCWKSLPHSVYILSSHLRCFLYHTQPTTTQNLLMLDLSVVKLVWWTFLRIFVKAEIKN